MMKSIPAILFLLVLILQPCAAVERIIVVGLFKDRALLELDGRQRLLVVGERSPEGVLLVSANSVEAILEINGVSEAYSLGTHIGAEYAAATGRTVTVTPDTQGMYRVNGSINGSQVVFVVDTGASVISMNRNVATRIGLDFREQGRPSVTNTASGQEQVFLVELDKVRVGEIELRNVMAAVHDSEFPQVLLLGNSFLSQVDMKREGRILQLQDQR